MAKFVAESCDALDGLVDGIISNYLACPGHVDLERLRCDGGQDRGDACLTDAQIALVNAVHSPFVLPFPVANGITTYPQWLYGNETTPDPQASTMARWVTGQAGADQRRRRCDIVAAVALRRQLGPLLRDA